MLFNSMPKRSNYILLLLLPTCVQADKTDLVFVNTNLSLFFKRAACTAVSDHSSSKHSSKQVIVCTLCSRYIVCCFTFT